MLQPSWDPLVLCKVLITSYLFSQAAGKPRVRAAREAAPPPGI